MGVIEKNSWLMSGAITELEKAGWNIVYIENNWILTESSRERINGPGYQHHVFHVHSKRNINYQTSIYQNIKPYKSCQHDMPDPVSFLFKLLRDN